MFNFKHEHWLAQAMLKYLKQNAAQQNKKQRQKYDNHNMNNNGMKQDRHFQSRSEDIRF